VWRAFSARVANYPGRAWQTVRTVSPSGIGLSESEQSVEPERTVPPGFKTGTVPSDRSLSSSIESDPIRTGPRGGRTGPHRAAPGRTRLGTVQCWADTILTSWQSVNFLIPDDILGHALISYPKFG
jgi:hypothetical protein